MALAAVGARTSRIAASAETRMPLRRARPAPAGGAAVVGRSGYRSRRAIMVLLAEVRGSCHPARRHRPLSTSGTEAGSAPRRFADDRVRRGVARVERLLVVDGARAGLAEVPGHVDVETAVAVVGVAVLGVQD